MITFLYALLLWIAIGNVIAFLHYCVYFHGIKNAFEHYRNKNLISEEESRNVERMLTKPGFSYVTIIIISASLLGPITIFSLVMDFYRFSIKL